MPPSRQLVLLLLLSLLAPTVPSTVSSHSTSPAHSIPSPIESMHRRRRKDLRSVKGKSEDEEEGRTEFVRMSYTEEEYARMFKKVRTYSTPNRFECFSCMAMSYRDNWKHLTHIYHNPKVFTDQCNSPNFNTHMPTVFCQSICVTMMEPEIQAGIFIGYKHIRGCLDKILKYGFNQTALRTHRFHNNNQCRTLTRTQLFMPVGKSDPPPIGDVQLCACYGDRCNTGSRSGSPLSRLLPLLILFFLCRIF